MRILILVLFLVGCSAPPFKPTGFNKTVILTTIVDDDLSRLGRDTATTKVTGTHERDGNKCTIWVPTIKTLDDEAFYTLGKEVAHCIWENYHKGIKDIY